MYHIPPSITTTIHHILILLTLCAPLYPLLPFPSTAIWAAVFDSCYRPTNRILHLVEQKA